MLESLRRFRVAGLHHSLNMDVPLDEANRLILVGENGTGKSTFVNLMYYFLTKQWTRLHDYRFVRIHAQLGDQDLVLTPEHLEQHFAARQHLSALMRVSRHSSVLGSHRLLDQLMDLALRDPAETESDLLERIAAEMRLPMRMVRDLLGDHVKETKGRPTHLQTLEKYINEHTQGQFLYLPTYRRIEQDLRSIFHNVDVDAELRKFQERLTRRSGKSFIELVEFGMEDVERTIADRMAQIKEQVRNGLNSLTGTYLRDVIRGVYANVDVGSLGDLHPGAIDAVFARIDDVTLPASDKLLLKEKVAAISATRTIADTDKVVAHFLSKLILLYAEQQANEKNVREFVRLSNQYLTQKQLVYDNLNYNLFVSRDQAPDGAPLPLSALSSGEKQIVSLLCHLFLSGETRFFVVIDEPELSLSVPWQRRFLPDIVNSGMCTGLVAVTHSPFIWENELERHVRALAEFTTPYTGGSHTTAVQGRG